MRPYEIAHTGQHVNGLAHYGASIQLYQCPEEREPDDGVPRTKLKHPIDYQTRYAFAVVDQNLAAIGYRVLPDPGFVLVYCPFHREKEVAGRRTAGFYNAIRASGGVNQIPRTQVKTHREDWGGFGAGIVPSSYRWLEFPGEDFPPQIVKND
jgi:hypothetical protein